MLWNARFWQASLLTTALGGIFLIGGPSVAQARDSDRQCHDRIRNEELKLRRDIDRHGFNSRQARHDRAKLEDLRERCRRERGRFDRDDRWRDRDRGWYDREGRWHDRDDRWHDRDGRWHDRDDRWRDRDRD